MYITIWAKDACFYILQKLFCISRHMVKIRAAK